MQVAQEAVFVGIDVAKYDFVVNICGSDRTRTYANDSAGIAALTGDLSRFAAPVRIAMEPTGGCELALWIALEDAGFHVRQVCAAHIKAFRDSLGRRAKTDRIDAMAIAAYLKARPEAGRVLPARKLRRIKALAAKRQQLAHARTALLCQQKQCTDDEIASMTAAMINLHDEQISALNAMIAALIEDDEALRERKRLLRSSRASARLSSQRCSPKCPNSAPSAQNGERAQRPRAGHPAERPMAGKILRPGRAQTCPQCPLYRREVRRQKGSLLSRLRPTALRQRKAVQSRHHRRRQKTRRNGQSCSQAR